MTFSAVTPFFTREGAELYHGDCLSVLPTIPTATVDCVVTDPPYGIDYVSNKQNCDTRGEVTVVKDRPKYFKTIQGDECLPVSWLPEAYRVLKDGAALYVFAHWSKWHLLYPAVESSGFRVKAMVVLNKSNHGMGDLTGGYAPKHELLLYAAKGRHVFNAGKRLTDVWNVPVKFSGAKRLHPNEKPTSWVEPCVLRSCPEGGTVLDPFVGSATTGEVAMKTGRRFIGIEVDAGHVGVAKDRLAGLDLTTEN